jgi:uncharacterized membrane protein
MRCNMSKVDRLLRALVVAPLLIVIGVLIGASSVGAIVLFALAGVMVATAAAGYCPLYPLIKLDTTRIHLRKA